MYRLSPSRAAASAPSSKAKEVISETKETVRRRSSPKRRRAAELTIMRQTAETPRKLRVRLDEAKAGATAVRSWVQNYRDALEHSPLRASAVTRVLCAAGGGSRRRSSGATPAPARAERPPKLRMARMATYGTLVCGPLLSAGTRRCTTSASRPVSYTPVVGGWLGRLPILSSLQVEAEAALRRCVRQGVRRLDPLRGPLQLHFPTMGALEAQPVGDLRARQEKFHRVGPLDRRVVARPVPQLLLRAAAAAARPRRRRQRRLAGDTLDPQREPRRGRRRRRRSGRRAALLARARSARPRE